MQFANFKHLKSLFAGKGIARMHADLAVYKTRNDRNGGRSLNSELFCLGVRHLAIEHDGPTRASHGWLGSLLLSQYDPFPALF